MIKMRMQKRMCQKRGNIKKAIMINMKKMKINRYLMSAMNTLQIFISLIPYRFVMDLLLRKVKARNLNNLHYPRLKISLKGSPYRC